MIDVTIRFKRLRPDAILPAKARPDDAGIDLFADETFSLPPGDSHAFATGVAWECPPGWYGQVRDRSGLAVRGLAVRGGVLDAGFRGEILVILTNEGEYGVTIEAGDRLAQMTLHEVPSVTIVEAIELTPSDRGKRGFGSSGC